MKKADKTPYKPSKSQKFRKPSNNELMNPDSPYFTPDWWNICEILPPDPWAYIVSDFQWSDEFFYQAHNRSIEITEAEIGHWPESSSPTTRLSYAFSLMLKLKDEIKDKISNKDLDTDFLWKWGEYQKAMAILHGALPGFDQRKPMKKAVTDKSIFKMIAREWYVLWYDWYCADRSPKKISRPMFDNYFQNILLEIREGKRKLPLFPTKKEMKAIINAFTDDPKDKENLLLTEFFTSKKFVGKKFEAARQKSLKNKLILPLVGEHNYPKIVPSLRT